MTDRKIPIRGQTATFSVNGAKRGDGMLLLYPDELTVVTHQVDRNLGLRWRASHLPGRSFYLFHTIGFGPVAIWYVAGWWAWQALARRLAARKVAAGGDGVTVIPLDQVTSVQCRKARKGAKWLGIRKHDRDDGGRNGVQVRRADGAVARPPRPGP